MAKYRKKPVVIEAIQFPGVGVNRVDLMVEFDDWVAARQGDRHCKWRGNKFVIPTLEGEMEANEGDWIIQGVAGELYPCKPDIFAATYDPA